MSERHMRVPLGSNHLLECVRGHHLGCNELRCLRQRVRFRNGVLADQVHVAVCGAADPLRKLLRRYNRQFVELRKLGGAGPIGQTVGPAVSLAGATWDLHHGQGGSTWRVSSYVRTSNATTSVMNLTEFYNDLVSRGWIPNTRYLSGVQTGTEVFTGTGSFTTNGFYCRVQ